MASVDSVLLSANVIASLARASLAIAVLLLAVMTPTPAGLSLSSVGLAPSSSVSVPVAPLVETAVPSFVTRTVAPVLVDVSTAFVSTS